MRKLHTYDNSRDRTLRTASGLVVAMLVLVGCGGDGKFDDDPAVQALRRQFDHLVKGQDGRRWDELHPAQQALISREAFAVCADASSIEIARIEVLEVFDEQTSIPGTDEVVASKAITVRVEASRGLISDEFEDTFHEVEFEGAWRWVMSPDGVESCLATGSTTTAGSPGSARPLTPTSADTAATTTASLSDGDVLALGTRVDLGGWNVAVTSVTPEPAAVPYEPVEGVEYRGFRIAVSGLWNGPTYDGDQDESTIKVDIFLAYVGQDKFVYHDFDCALSGLPLGRMVVAGGEDATEFCLALPAAALGTGELELRSWTGDDRAWSAPI